MWEWSDQRKLGKSSAFAKRNLRRLPLAEAAIEADFFLEAASSSNRPERWMGMVIEREFGGVLAMQDVRLGPPTVNGLATLSAHAMLRPLNGGDRQRPRTIYLRDRPQWQELLPPLRHLGIDVVLSEDLPGFREAVIDRMQRTKAKKRLSADEIQATLRQPFPPRKPTCFTEAMDLMAWTETMSKGAYPSRKVAVPSYDPMIVVRIHLTADELKTIATRTTIAKTKNLRPQLEAMAAEGKAIELGISDWSRVLWALCGMSDREVPICKHSLRIARRISDELAEALGSDGPALRTRQVPVEDHHVKH